MADPDTGSGIPATQRYAAQADHPRNRITVREWQMIGRALEVMFGKQLKDLIRDGLFTPDTLGDLTPETSFHLRRKIGLHMGMAMVAEYATEFPSPYFTSATQENYLAKVAIGQDENVVSVAGRLMRRGNTFVIHDQHHVCNGLTCTLVDFKIGSSVGMVQVEMYGVRIEVTLAHLHEVRF